MTGLKNNLQKYSLVYYNYLLYALEDKSDC
jgi:hypothetical protein